MTGARRVGAQLSAMHAASAIKPPKRGGVTWADCPSPAAHAASDRCLARLQQAALLPGCCCSYFRIYMG